MPAPPQVPCPCGHLNAQRKPTTFAHCCQPLLNGQAVASTAEQLMRSRYTAYALGHMDYVATTWHPSTRPSELLPDPDTRWLGLDVKSHSPNCDQAEVVFVARYRLHGKGHRMTERSRFVRQEGVWWYVDAA